MELQELVERINQWKLRQTGELPRLDDEDLQPEMAQSDMEMPADEDEIATETGEMTDESASDFSADVDSALEDVVVEPSEELAVEAETEAAELDAADEAIGEEVGELSVEEDSESDTAEAADEQDDDEMLEMTDDADDSVPPVESTQEVDDLEYLDENK